MRVYLGLGSNMGNRLANLQGALTGLGRAGAIVAIAALYESTAVGQPGQQPYWNSALALESDHPLPSLLREAKRLEYAMGRRPGAHWDSRPLDIDLLLAGEMLATADLTVPHPLLAERPFVLWPLAEIAGRAIHPPSGQTITALRDGIAAGSLRRIAGPEWATAVDLRGRRTPR